MHRIEAEFEIVTPMFLGGADPEGAAELRAASIKGALRFWWRALAWGRLRDLEAIHKEEERVFGSSEKKVGQGAFLLRIVEQELLQVKSAGVRLIDSDARTVLPGARYLGYGLMKAFGTNLGTLERGCIQAGRFRLELLFRPVSAQKLAEQEQDLASVLAALQAFGLLGGLGARTRRGWGSVALRTLKVDHEQPTEGNLPESPKAYAAAVQSCLGVAIKGSGKEPPFTAFAETTRIELPQPSAEICTELAINRDRMTALQCLAAVGSAMLLYRSWGRGGKVRLVDPPPQTKPRDIVTSRTFKDDHDWYKWFADGAGPSKRPTGLAADFHPARIVFGLPHNYRGVDVTGVDTDRRGSPLFIHIHRTNAGQYFAAISILPALFLPNVQPKTDAEWRDLKAKQFEATREFSKKRENGSEAKYNRRIKASQNIAMVGEHACSCIADQVDWDHLYKLLESAGFDQDPARRKVVLGGVAP
jgi:CRISPR-associated protein Cmr1